jgi:hypothetical protein
MVVSISESWFQTSPLLRLMANADSSLGINVVIQGLSPEFHQKSPLFILPDPVTTYASVPSFFQSTTALPTPIHAVVFSQIPVALILSDRKHWLAAPVVGFIGLYQHEPAHTQGVSAKSVGTDAVQGIPHTRPAMSLPVEIVPEKDMLLTCEIAD